VIVTLCARGVPAAWGQDAVNQLERNLALPLDGPGTAAVVDSGAGYLGMSVDLAAPDGDAVFVVSVAEGGPAQRSGLRADDVIVSVNEVPIRKLEDMDRAVRKPVGTKLVFQVRRGAATQRVELVLGERPAAAAETVTELPEPAAAPGEAPSIPDSARPNLGISVTDISDLTRRRFAVTVNNGAVISQIREGSPAARAGLPLGGVIVSVNGRRVGSANDLVSLIQAFRPGDEVELTYFEGDRIGRKKVRLVPGAPTDKMSPTRPVPDAAAADPTDPPLRLGRRRTGGRPILDALERTLDAVLPPDGAAGNSAVPSVPLPPPPSRPVDGGDDTLPPPPTPPGRTADGTDDPFTPPPPPLPESRKPAAGFNARQMAPDPPPPPPPGKSPEGEAAKSVLVPADSKVPPPAANAELTELRQQMETLKKQLEQLQRRIDELEGRRRQAGG
jgi:hypothetical protein